MPFAQPRKKRPAKNSFRSSEFCHVPIWLVSASDPDEFAILETIDASAGWGPRFRGHFQIAVRIFCNSPFGWFVRPQMCGAGQFARITGGLMRAALSAYGV